jgi:hypothetical protein
MMRKLLITSAMLGGLGLLGAGAAQAAPFHEPEMARHHGGVTQVDEHRHHDDGYYDNHHHHWHHRRWEHGHWHYWN